MVELLIWLGLPAMVAIGIGIGRLSVTEQQRITRLRQDRQRWRLYLWQQEIDAVEGRCMRCRT
jgi:hypothetical protein